MDKTKDDSGAGREDPPTSPGEPTATHVSSARRRTRSLLQAFLVLVIALYTVWAWPEQSDSIRGYPDSVTYMQFPRMVKSPSGEWVERNRPITYPLVLKAVGRFEGLVYFQSWFSLAAWCTLGWVLARHAGLAVFGLLSFAPTIRMWNLSVLTESLSFSLLALGIAVGLVLCRGIRWPWVMAWLVVVVPFGFLRDGNLLLLPFFTLPFIPPLVSGQPRRESSEPGDLSVSRETARGWLRFGLVVAFVGFLVVIGLRSADRNVRWRQPLYTALYTMVRPDPAAVQYFRDAGMPGELFDEDPGWDTWVRETGRGVYARWIVGRWESYRMAWEFVDIDDEREKIKQKYFRKPTRAGLPKAAISPVADWFYGATAPSPWLMMFVFALPLADRLSGRPIRVVSLLPGALLAASIVQTFTGYWGAGTEVYRHTLIGSLLYRVAFLSALVAIVSALPRFRRAAEDSRDPVCIAHL